MDIFPTQYSTLSSVALKVFLEKQYGLTVTACRLLIRNVSDTYIIESQSDKYIFKIYRDAHRKLDEIKGEVELLNILKGRGAKVSYPIPDLTGNGIQVFNAAEGIRHGVMFSYAKGKVHYSLTDNQLNVLGAEMAAVHNITARLELNYPRKPFTIATTITEPIKTIEPAFEELPDEYAWLLTEGHKVAKKLKEFDPDSFSYGYCQYDFLPKNFHYDESDNITFFDFDFAGQGYLANDITTFYVHYFLEVSSSKMSRIEADRCFRVFVDSYRKTRPLSDEELKAIPYLGFGFWVFYLGFQYENFDDWSNIFFGARFLKDRTALIKKWMAYFE